MILIPVVLSLLLLAAHFLRGGGLVVAVAILGLLLLLPVRRPWVARVMQLVLTLGTLEWIRTLATLAMRRSQQGEPFLRMAMILGSVAAVTLVSALLFETQKLRRIYGTGGSASGSGEHTDATSSNRTEDCSTD